MASNTKGIGLFTAENIAAVLRTLRETYGTYDRDIKQAREYGAAGGSRGTVLLNLRIP